MSPSTTHRYIKTLERERYIEKTAERRYRLSLGAVGLGLSALRSVALSAHARSFLAGLSEVSGFTAAVGVSDWSEVLVVAHERGQRHGRPAEGYLGGEERLPVYCTAMGKLLLAALPSRARDGLVGELSLVRRTPRTVTSKRDLLRDLGRLGGEPVVAVGEEHSVGVLEIAAAVRGEGGETVAALALEASSELISLDELVRSHGPHLLAAADELSVYLGYRRADGLREERLVGVRG